MRISDWSSDVCSSDLIKHVDIDESMIRAIAKQAEAERVRRARVINAEGEQQAAEKLVQAAVELSRQPEAMQLRYLAGLQDIAGERNSTIVFPFPIELARSEEHTSELHSLMRISYAVFCLKKKTKPT